MTDYTVPAEVKFINLHDFISTTEAIQFLVVEIETIETDYAAIRILHGYGSTGVGGSIKKATLEKLKELKDAAVILDYIPGEDFDIFNEKARNALFDIPKLHEYYNNGDRINHGVTFVILDNNYQSKINIPQHNDKDIYLLDLFGSQTSLKTDILELEQTITNIDRSKYSAIRISHNYNYISKNNLKTAVRSKLVELKKSGIIAGYIFGENFSFESKKTHDILKKIPKMKTVFYNKDSHNSNVTIVYFDELDT